MNIIPRGVKTPRIRVSERERESASRETYFANLRKSTTVFLSLFSILFFCLFFLSPSKIYVYSKKARNASKRGEAVFECACAVVRVCLRVCTRVHVKPMN